MCKCSYSVTTTVSFVSVLMRYYLYPVLSGLAIAVIKVILPCGFMPLSVAHDFNFVFIYLLL